ncbi:shikimate dehydrogenase family protein [Streptomyces sp. NPDC004065]|uniref:shikimate dehydrogenase family protein n=1 Tax=Streptomyces sp. NPDC004065 TaxID=3364689 RepID=UPI00384DE611
MTGRHAPAARPTMYFVGVTTTKSSIMKVFPAWARELNLDAVIEGIDLPLDDTPEHYREVVAFIKKDPQSLGALVTTHKLNLFKATRDLFDGVGEETRLLEEVSSISKRGQQLWGHAMDPLTSGLSLEALVPDSYWSATGAELLLLGAGGSSLALTLYLHNRARAGRDVPSRIIVTNRREARLREMRDVHERLGCTLPIEYHLAPEPERNDEQLRALQPKSVVVNATGLGKDRPGSPLTDAAVFPRDSLAWDFNYRGELVFLDQARAQRQSRGVRVVDGWLYFIHGWTRVIAEVFHIDIPTHGPAFERLSRIARDASQENA